MGHSLDEATLHGMFVSSPARLCRAADLDAQATTEWTNTKERFQGFHLSESQIVGPRPWSDINGMIFPTLDRPGESSPKFHDFVLCNQPNGDNSGPSAPTLMQALENEAGGRAPGGRVAHQVLLRLAVSILLILTQVRGIIMGVSTFDYTRAGSGFADIPPSTCTPLTPTTVGSSFRGCGVVGELGEHFRLVSANADAPPPPLRFTTVGSKYGRSGSNPLFPVSSRALRSLRVTSFLYHVFGWPATTTPYSVQPGPTPTISIRQDSRGKRPFCGRVLPPTPRNWPL